MKTTHTKGPWFVNGAWNIQADTHTEIPVVVATVTPLRSGSLEQREENACLIAAAPDLLEACKAAEAAIRVEKTLQAHRGESVAVELGIAHSELLKAISKAEDNT